MAEVMECIREESQVLDILSSFYLLLAFSPHTLPSPFIHGDFWQMLTLMKSKWCSLDSATSEGLRKISVPSDGNDRHFTANVPHRTCAQEPWRDPPLASGAFHSLLGVVPAPVASNAQLLVLVRGDILLLGKWLLFNLNAYILNNLLGSF